MKAQTAPRIVDVPGRLRAIAMSERQVAQMRGECPDGTVPQTQAFLAELAEILADHLEREMHGYSASGEQVTVRP